MSWMISNLENKSVTETETWVKDGETIKHEIGWRWAKWRAEVRPDLSTYDEVKGCDPYDEFAAELDTTDDSCWEEWYYPSSWGTKEIEAFEELWQDQWHDAPLVLGFSEEDTVRWVTGPLGIEEITDDEEDVEPQCYT